MPKATLLSSLLWIKSAEPVEDRSHCDTKAAQLARKMAPVHLAPPLRSAPPNAAPLAVALILSGSYDSSHGYGIPSRFVDLFGQNLVQGIIRANPRNSVHTFVCAAGPQKSWTYRGGAIEPRLQPDWSKLQGMRSDVTILNFSVGYNSGDDIVGGADPQYERMEACYLKAKDHQQKHVHHQHKRDKFTHFIRARFDLEIYAPLAREAFDDEKVSVRARALILADECDKVDYQSVAAPAWKTLGSYRLKHTPVHRNKFNNATFTWNVDGPNIGVPRWYIPKWRMQMLNPGSRGCWSADDMFAVVPAHLADAYFLRPGVLQRITSLPFGWDLDRSNRSRAAAIETYGPALDPLRFRTTCSFVPFSSQAEACGLANKALCPPALANSCDYVGLPKEKLASLNTSLAVLCAHADQPWRGGAHVEGRITARLQSRLVPVQFVPLTYRACIYGGHGRECSAGQLKSRMDTTLQLQASKRMVGSVCRRSKDTECEDARRALRACTQMSSQKYA